MRVLVSALALSWVSAFVLGCGGGPSTFARPTTSLPSTTHSAEEAYAATLHVREWGDATNASVVVLVHGLGEAASADWEPIAPALATSHRVIAVDLPGFGESEAANSDGTPEFFADAVATFLGTLGTRAHLVGHSMGGLVALLVAGGHPELVGQLILIDVGGVLHREAFADSLAIDPVRESGGALGRFGARVAQAAVRTSRAFEPGETNLRAMSGGSTAMAVMLTNASAAMDGVRAETLVLWGENDTIAPLRTARILESRIAGRLVVLPDVGHVPMREATEATLRHITEHLDPSSGGLGMRGVSSQGQVVCEGERGVEYRGTMHSLSLRDCHDVRIEDASIGQLIVEHSDGFMTNTEVGATFVSGAPTGSGLQLTRGSTFVVTGGTIQGEVAIALDQSRLDIAGTVIEATEMPFTVRAKSRVLFSSVRVSGPGGVTHAHGSVNLSQ